jgi:hypothetical protein
MWPGTKSPSRARNCRSGWGIRSSVLPTRGDKRFPTVTRQVQAAGYEYALTTQPSLFSKSSDAWLIPRIPISGNVVRDDSGYFAAELANFSMNSAAFRRSALRVR